MFKKNRTRQSLIRNRVSFRPLFHTPPDGLGTYATEPHTQQSLIQAIVSYAPRRFRKSQGKLPSKISARALKQSRRNFAPEFRLFPATLSYAPLLSGFASEAAEGRRRSETHPTLQRNRLSTHPRGVRNVRSTVSTQHSLNAPQDNGVIAG